MKIKLYLLLITLTLFISSCKYFEKNEGEIHIPEGITEQQLQEQRYKYKTENAYKEEFIHQDKTDSVTVTVFNAITYQMKDDGTSIGEGYDYYIMDIGVENFSYHPFRVGAFTKSCHLTTSDPKYLFSNVSFALKMYFLQSDSAEIDMSYIKKFYLDTMAPKDFYRAKVFAYEVSKEEKDALFFHYTIGNQKFEVKVRDKQP
ncbi:MAG: hypothetical protein JWN78_3059 [Bacteroidota bacterium]|nr:hypothetical protein [Bacteroidota bacterium]